ncbi:MAG: hypothetical protein R8M45_09275, partial [Ghiorsea sp.]
MNVGVLIRFKKVPTFELFLNTHGKTNKIQSAEHRLHEVYWRIWLLNKAGQRSIWQLQCVLFIIAQARGRNNGQKRLCAAQALSVNKKTNDKSHQS